MLTGKSNRTNDTYPKIAIADTIIKTYCANSFFSKLLWKNNPNAMPATNKQISDIVILSTLGVKTFSKKVRVFFSVNVGAKISNHTLINCTIATPLFFSSTYKCVVHIKNIIANHTRTMYSILISSVYLIYRFTSEQVGK
tara:strand:+ start:676 stop:1095 length:420 start_codon:yes stop_codon:yes gene_type:complete